MTVPPISVAHAVALTIDRCHPSKHAFFDAMCAMKPEQLAHPIFLGKTYNFCQMVMHQLRLATMRLPFLDTIELHQHQLAVAFGNTCDFFIVDACFESLGAIGMMPLNDFRQLSDMRLAPEYLPIVPLEKLIEAYTNSLGAWCVSEQMVVDWLRTIKAALARVFVNSEIRMAVDDHCEIVNASVQTVMDSNQPRFQGQIFRGMAVAGDCWQEIFAAQYDMILRSINA